ncbi:MAG: hypothetical protein KDE51_01470, partial [Anaerolineales bacterium]|nr:hypothetical protein [Anaerolineales bacterium]
MRHQIILLGLLCLLALLLGGGVMTAHFHSIDEVALFTAAVNLSTTGEPHTNQLGDALWSIRPGEEVVMRGEEGTLFTKKSPLMILALWPLVKLGQTINFLSPQQAALLFGPLALALTTLLFVWLSQLMRFDIIVATVGALLLLLATMVWPYAQTIFGEWLATLGILLILGGWLLLKQTAIQRPWVAPFVIGSGATLCVGGNVVYLILAALLGVALCWTLFQQHGRQWPHYVAPLSAFALPLVLLALGLLFYNHIRFGNPFTTGYRLTPGQEGFTTPLWWGVLGLLISPARGLIWYAPPVILAIFGFRASYRRLPQLTILIVIITLFHLLAFGSWWEWWGGYGWGPRFLLPLVAPLLLIGLPAVETAVNGRWSARLALTALLFSGLAVQVAGLTINSNIYEQQLDALAPAPAAQFLWYHHDPTLVYDIAASPIVWHWQQLLLQEQAWQISWWSSPSQTDSVLMANLTAASRSGDVLLSLASTLQTDFLNEAQRLPPVYGLPVNLPATDPLAQQLFHHALEDAQRVWLITWYGTGDPANFYEAQLRQNWGSLSDYWQGDWRVALLAAPPEKLRPYTVTGTVGPLTLAHLATAVDEQQLFVQLTWQTAASLPPNLVSYVHLVDSNGQIVAQQDRPP